MHDFRQVTPYFNQAALAIIGIFTIVAPAVLAKPEIGNIAFHPVPLPVESLSSTAGPLQDGPIVIQASPTANTLQLKSIDQYLSSIQELEASGGPFNPVVAQNAESLGDLLLQSKQHADAIEAFEKCLHIIRINEGLNSPSQEGILHKLIKGELALNNLPRAHELQEALLYLKRKNHEKGDPDYIAAILEWADWNLELLQLNDDLRGKRHNEMAFDVNQSFITAQQNYIDAIELIHASPEQADKELLIDAERKLAAINYIAKNRNNNLQARYSSVAQTNDSFSAEARQSSKAEIAYFFNGSNALKRAIAYSLENPQPDYLSISEQMMALGDWYMLFDRRTAALTIYEDAFEVLDAIQASDEEIRKVMSPGMPVMTPGVADSGNTLEETDFSGYIDVEFKVSKFGIASRPAVIGTSETEKSPVTKALIRKIRQENFRPAFVDGSATGSNNVKLRYYYSYNQ